MSGKSEPWFVVKVDMCASTLTYFPTASLVFLVEIYVARPEIESRDANHFLRSFDYFEKG